MPKSKIKSSTSTTSVQVQSRTIGLAAQSISSILKQKPKQTPAKKSIKPEKKTSSTTAVDKSKSSKKSDKKTIKNVSSSVSVKPVKTVPRIGSAVRFDSMTEERKLKLTIFKWMIITMMYVLHFFAMAYSCLRPTPLIFTYIVSVRYCTGLLANYVLSFLVVYEQLYIRFHLKNKHGFFLVILLDIITSILQIFKAPWNFLVHLMRITITAYTMNMVRTL